MFPSFILLALLSTAFAVEFRIMNNANQPYFIHIQGPGVRMPEFNLQGGATYIDKYPDSWAGKIWAQAACNNVHGCENDENASVVEFTVASGTAQFDILTPHHKTEIDVSVEVLSGTRHGRRYDCPNIGCSFEIIFT